MLPAGLQLEGQIRQRDRVAELLRAARGTARDEARFQDDSAENRIPLCPLRWPPGSRVRRWAEAYGTALVQQRRRAQVRSRGRGAAYTQDVRMRDLRIIESSDSS